MREVYVKRDERGFTLPEVLATVVILGILVTIAVIVLLGILEQRRVDAAALQLASDMRLAHTRATNQLTDWRVVVVLEIEAEESGPDYYLVRLENPYGSGVAPKVTSSEPRFFSGRLKMKNVKTAKGFLVDNQSEDYWVSPWGNAVDTEAQTKTLEFNSDGTMSFFESPNGSVCITQDGNPQARISTLSATSRVRIYSGSDCDTTVKGD